MGSVPKIIADTFTQAMTLGVVGVDEHGFDKGVTARFGEDIKDVATAGADATKEATAANLRIAEQQRLDRLQDRKDRQTADGQNATQASRTAAGSRSTSKRGRSVQSKLGSDEEDLLGL